MKHPAYLAVGRVLGLGIVMVALPGVGEAQTTTRVSVATGGGQANGGGGGEPAISANGRFVVFDSDATNLVAGDTNGVGDVFVHDRQTGITSRVSVTPGGLQGNGESWIDGSGLSSDGRLVAFASDATNLVPGDTPGQADVFVHDRQTGITTRVSVATGGGPANFGSENVNISMDGRIVAFSSDANNLVPGDTNGVGDTFVHDRQTGITTRVSVGTGGLQGNRSGWSEAALSSDGRFVAFSSEATNLAPGDTNGRDDVFVHDRQTGTTTRVSVATGGLQANGESGNDNQALSADGRFVTFSSDANNLVSGDTNGVSDIFVHDRQTGTTTRVSVATGGLQANGESGDSDISPDGRWVAFWSDANNLVPGDTNGVEDTFVHDRQTGITTRVSVGSGGGQGNGDSGEGTLSADGRWLVFGSDATNLVPGDTNGVGDIFVYGRGVSSGGSSSRTDLNGDGKADIVWRNTSSGVVAVWLMNGTTISASGFPAGVPFEWQIPGVGDVNADGKADIIWRNGTSGTVAVWLMNGLTINSVGFPGSTSTDWEIEQIGDVDGNGTADLLWRNINSGVVAVWLMNGTTILSSGFLGGVPVAWQIAGIGDVNGDGKADVIWRNGSSGTVAVWVMDGLTITAVGFPGSASTDFEIKGIGDVDGNGMADLIWRNTSSVVVWQMNGTTIASSGFLSGKSAEWEIAQVGDTDGDGKADVIWRNTSTGEVEVWLLNGLAITATGSPGTTSPEWEIE